MNKLQSILFQHLLDLNIFHLHQNIIIYILFYLDHMLCLYNNNFHIILHINMEMKCYYNKCSFHHNIRKLIYNILYYYLYNKHMYMNILILMLVLHINMFLNHVLKIIMDKNLYINNFLNNFHLNYSNSKDNNNSNWNSYLCIIKVMCFQQLLYIYIYQNYNNRI